MSEEGHDRRRFDSHAAVATAASAAASAAAATATLLARLDERTGAIAENVEKLCKQLPVIEKRVDSLEATRDRLGGIAAALSFLGAIIWGGLEWLFHKH